MNRVLILILPVVLALLSGCTPQSEPEDSQPSSIVVRYPTGIDKDISQTIENKISNNLAMDLEHIVVLANNDESSVSISVSLLLPTDPIEKGTLFYKDAQTIVPIALAAIEEKEVDLTKITLLANNKNNAYDPDGLICWKSEDGKVGTYANNTDGQQVFITSVALSDIPEK